MAENEDDGVEAESAESGYIDLEVLAAALETLRQRGVKTDDPDEALAYVAGLLALVLAERGVSNPEEAIGWVAEMALDLHTQISEGL